MIGYEIKDGSEHVYKDSLGTIAVGVYVNGTLTNAGAGVNVTVVDEAGTTVIDDQSASTDSTGVYHYDIGIANTTDVKKLYAVWTGTWETVVQKARTSHEVLGFPIFTEAQARAFDIEQLSSATDYPDEDIFRDRARITDLLEQWTGVSWSPKYNQVKVAGEKDHTISLPNFHVTKLISVKVKDETIATSNFEIDNNAGFIYRTDSVFPVASSDYPMPVVIEYEHGWDYLRNGVDRVGLKLLLDRLISTNIPDRATSFNDELGNISLVTQGGGFKNPTRIPEVNQWIEENSEKVFGI